MKELRLGVLGAGRIGKVHAASITQQISGTQVAVICDPRLEFARSLAESLGVVRYTDDYRQVLADPDVDAVLICTPTNTHAEIAIAAAKAGKHIFCEKPVDLTLAKIKETQRAVEAAGVKMQVGFNRRFDHNHGRVRELAQAGALGKVEVVKITSRDPEPPSAEYAAASGGLFIDMMIHDFDMAMFQAGSDVKEVYTAATCLVDPAIGKAGDVDTAIVTLTFENGALGVIDNSRRAAYGYDQRVEVFGEKGMALDENDGDTTVRLSTAAGVVSDKPQYFFMQRYVPSFVSEMKAFVDAVMNDKPVAVGLHEGLMSVAVAKAAKKSLDEHRPVSLREILEEA